MRIQAKKKNHIYTRGQGDLASNFLGKSSKKQLTLYTYRCIIKSR